MVQQKQSINDLAFAADMRYPRISPCERADARVYIGAGEKARALSKTDNEEERK